MLFLAIFADFIANDVPLIAKSDGSLKFPVFSKIFTSSNTESEKYEWKLNPPIAYTPQNLTLEDKFLSPFEAEPKKPWNKRHKLGTDGLGRDVLSALIHGTRNSFLVGFVAIGISSIIGITLGAFAGYFGDNSLKANLFSIILSFMFLLIGSFYGFEVRKFILKDAAQESFNLFFKELLLSLFIVLLFQLPAFLFKKLFKKISSKSKKIRIPLDIIISRIIEIFMAVPKLLIILSLVALFPHPSIYIVMFIIGISSWTGIARFTRAEFLRISKLEYITSARAFGFSDFRIILRHALPNALSPLIVSIAFSISAAILIETALSYLEIGVSAEHVSWGSLLSAARSKPSAWWLAVFPGIAIFLSVFSFNLLGEQLKNQSQHE